MPKHYVGVGAAGRALEHKLARHASVSPALTVIVNGFRFAERLAERLG